ncbi:Clr5 domain-containing protein [Pestalotiopsis sp. NC0098]|nr:Clr5 domain-containing protein [Pestalotiopsis sp. NC0098]
MPSELEWESQKDAIYGLYIKENRKLRDLQEEMRLAGFSATKSQYETKFKAWRFFKNDTKIPATTWKHVAHKVEKRKRDNKESDVFINGVQVDHKRVRKEISRYRYSTTERVQLGQYHIHPPLDLV